jgi:hypothetical protein
MRSLAAIVAAAAVIAGSLGCASQETRSHVDKPLTFATARPLTLRIEAGTVWASPNAVSPVNRAWRVPAHGPVEDLAVEALPENRGFLVSFRQGGAGWRGELDSSRSPRGPLQMMVDPSLAVAPGSAISAR